MQVNLQNEYQTVSNVLSQPASISESFALNHLYCNQPEDSYCVRSSFGIMKGAYPSAIAILFIRTRPERPFSSSNV